VRWIDKLSRAQRIVVAVALGAVLMELGSYLPSLGQRGIAFGWVGYAPLTAPVDGWPDWLRLVLWLALTGIWAVVSIRLLRPSKHDDSG
jgi:hypothetical protein